jgi:hypothetical protein
MGKRKAKEVEGEAKPKKKRRGGFKKLVFLLLIGGGAALALSEDLRNKALDALFGSEEEFQYSPPSAPGTDASSGASASV